MTALKKVPCTLPMSVARLYLYGLQGQWGLKTLHGITTAPVLKNDGTIRVGVGFDDETGLYCHQIPNVAVPEKPTEDDARTALHHLRYFFRTFPYTDADRLRDNDLDVVDLSKPPAMDESTFLVALMTAVCRQSLELAPGYLVRAAEISGAGTGKGLIVAAVCIVSSGARPTAFTAGHDKEEMDKRLSAALIEQRPSVFLDNYNNAELKSDVLASALTQNPAMVRRMGQTKMTPLYTRTFIAITGNGVKVAEDMARRLLITDFDAHTENPENRKFAPGFLDTVAKSRVDLLTHALTIWRWGRQNKIKAGRPLGSYELWARWCRDPLLALGCRDPIDRLAETKAVDPMRMRLVEIFEAWSAHHGDILIKANDLHTDVLELIDFKAKRKDTGELIVNRQWIASYLRSKVGARVGGFVLQQIKDPGQRRPIAYYKLQKTTEAN
jgi:putative DNA primase/helicase